MRITLSFSRIVAGIKEEMGTLIFTEGDYYNIYNHMVMDKGFEHDPEKVYRFAGFRINSITNEKTTIEKIAPPIQTEELEINGKVEFDFGYYGVYTITQKDVQM